MVWVELHPDMQMHSTHYNVYLYVLITVCVLITYTAVSLSDICSTHKLSVQSTTDLESRRGCRVTCQLSN